MLDGMELIFEVRDAEEGAFMHERWGTESSPKVRPGKNSAPMCLKRPPFISNVPPSSPG